MERIQKALEQAAKERQGLVGKRPLAAQQTGIYKVEYTHTKVVPIPEKVFRDNRIIAAVPQHELKDAYRMLRTRVLQAMRSNNWNSVAITGPASGCGKTLTAINLAVSLAMEVTQTVLLVDLDLRKPSVHRYLEYQPEFGISDYLFDDVPIEKVMFSPGIDRLVILPGREGIHNSSEMLRSPKMLTLVDELKNRYPDRLVVVDLPPVLAADDALAFSPYIDAMLLVAEDGSTRKEHLQKSLEVLKGAHIIGTVLNKADTSHTGYGYYHAEPSARGVA
jgi:capsular exopolysaccharide synthesis family protein